MATYRIVFDTVKEGFSRSGRCSVCGKYCKRRTTIEHSINPYNVTKDGRPKGRSEVYKDVLAKGAEWEAKPLVCRACEEGKTDDQQTT